MKSKKKGTWKRIILFVIVFAIAVFYGLHRFRRPESREETTTSVSHGSILLVI